VLGTLVAAACHDFKHNGFTNFFHINISSDIAIGYNGMVYLFYNNNNKDISVLENYHASETFKIIHKEGNNLFEKMNLSQYRLVRKCMIECILATDMASHANLFNSFKSKLESLKISNGNNLQNLIIQDTDKDYLLKNKEMQQMILSYCVHTSDLSGPAKPREISDKLEQLIYKEFFKQGDIEKEKGLPVSFLCDRTTTNVNKSQVGFINYIVLPQFSLIHSLLPEIQYYIDNIQENLKYHQQMASTI